MSEAFTVGNRVTARGLNWDVADVVALGEQTLLHLRCAEGDMAGLEWDLLYPTEPVALVRAELRPDAPGTLSHWRLYHQACLLEQVLSPTDALLVTPGRVRIEPYQFVPLMRALELPRPRLLLADGVGLGKTIEAGLIASEFIARRRAHRVLVVAPAGPLLVQWAQELRQRFGLRFTAITNAASLQKQRRRLELGGNPFNAIALCLTSMDFAKQERVLEELERSVWDLAIIDEAHHCVSATESTYREDTQRRRLAEVVARRSDGLLLLTATPHDGHDAHFASLIELLDPSLVDGRGSVLGNAYRRHVVRRLKSHIRDAATGEPKFHERCVMPVKISMDDDDLQPARQFHRELAALIAPRLRRAAQGREHADALAFVSLLKRSASTINACVNTLRRVAERYRASEAGETEALRRERTRALRAYRRRLQRFGVLEQTDEEDLSELEADGMAADLHSFAVSDPIGAPRIDATAAALAALIRLGEATEACDPKLRAVVREVAAIRAMHPMTNILIYTEFADSQLAMVKTLRGRVDGEVLAISGLDDERERSRVAERCAQEDGIVLVSTDSLAEGLNLQQRCFNLIHLDLPYNPNRLEQRNGRIDRYGQERDPQIRYLYLAGTFEERLLLHLIAKYEKARAQLTVMPQTLGVTADESAWSGGLVAGFAERQATLFNDATAEIRMLDAAAEAADADAYRDLLQEIDRAFAGFDLSAVRHGWWADHATDVDMIRASERHDQGVAVHIDLPDFVAAILAEETGYCMTDADNLRIPADWQADIDELPGFDPACGTLHFTRDQARLRDADGRSLALLGRAHPLVRRAISRAQRLSAGGGDNRVGVARAAAGEPMAVLFTYSLELCSVQRLELRRTIAALLERDGTTTELLDPQQWLRLADADRQCDAEHVWQRQFAHWVPHCQPQVDATMTSVMRREVDRFADVLRRSCERAVDALQAWAGRRADEICGACEPATVDLFGEVAPVPDWRSLSRPIDRLTAFSVDAGNTPTRRREANRVVELLVHRTRDYAACAALGEPILRPTGLLMLVPSACR